MESQSLTIDQVAVDQWLSRFEAAVRSRGEDGALEALFLPDAYWRDGLALTWQLTTWYGIEQIAEGVRSATMDIETLEFDPTLEMRWTERNGRDHIEVPYRFTTAIGRGRGYARLVERDGELVGWTAATILESLTGHGERIDGDRPTGYEYARTFSGPNWLDKRETEARFDGREPEVLIAGGGQAGLTAAARLRQLGVDVLIVDPMDRAGDNWRHRYHSLTLHNEVEVCHLPYMPFPQTWPTYIPKDMLATWFETYAIAMELNFWGRTRLVAGEYDDAAQSWVATVRHDDGTERVLRPQHLILATGVSGKPVIPNLAGADDFANPMIHTSRFNTGEAYSGKKVLVVGSGTSGHDTAQELHGAGAKVTMMQRSATAIVSAGPSTAGRLYAPYLRGRPTDETDLKSASTPYPLNRHSMQLLTRTLKVTESELYSGLEAAGFRITHGDDDLGFAGKFFEEFGGYYLDVGCSSLIVKGEISVVQFSDFDRFVPEGIRMTNGDIHEFDAVILATGYEGQTSIAGEILGDEVRDKLGAVWGFDEQGELRNMWRPTAQKGLWLAGGGFAQCRINSKFIALQIKGRLLGLVPEQADSDQPLGAVRPQDVCDVEEFTAGLERAEIGVSA